MKKFLMLVAVLSVACLQETKADVDPNFYVYLCRPKRLYQSFRSRMGPGTLLRSRRMGRI